MGSSYDPTVWSYRCEGSRSLVIANRQLREVFRLSKCYQGNNREDHEVSRETIEGRIGYVKHVIQPLFGNMFVRAGEIVHLPKGFAESVNKHVLPYRPGHRLEKEVDTEVDFVVCLPDCCFVKSSKPRKDEQPTFCVEIKPKVGFLPTSQFICDKNRVKHSVCRFCMHQYSKIKEGKWKHRSSYCPVDLFSGDCKRISHTLGCLLQNPQNNIRVFKDGLILHGGENTADLNAEFKPYFGDKGDTSKDGKTNEQRSPVECFQELLTQCILNVSGQEENGGQVPQQNGHSTDAAQTCRGSVCREYAPGRSLPPGCVLHRILQVQLLDELDIEGVQPLYERVAKHIENHPEDRERLHIDGPYDKWDVQLMSVVGEREDDGSLEYALQRIKEYLVSRTAKDCQIMVAMQPISSRPQTSTDEVMIKRDHYGNLFQCSVSVIDLDPKHFDKIQMYLEEDAEIVQYFLKDSHYVE